MNARRMEKRQKRRIWGMISDILVSADLFFFMLLLR